MKKRLFPLIATISLLITSIFSFLVDKETKKVEADNDSLHSIGLLYKVQYVSSQTKVYIAPDEVDFYNSNGRPVYSEFYFPPFGGGVELESLNGDGLNVIDQPLLRYYYYASAHTPILLESRMLYNDYESLVYAIEYLEEEFAHFNPNANIKNAVLSYVRGMDTEYFNEHLPMGYNIYTVVCGDPNVQVILDYSYPTGVTYDYTYQFIDDFNVPGLKIKNFFASFVQYTYNSNYYGATGAGVLNRKYKLINPNTGIDEIDLIHMFASMDGNFEGTGQSTGNSPFDLVSPNVYRYVVSWAGDLQQAAKSYSIAQNQPELLNFSQVLNGNFDFDYCDFYADLDAVNMAFGVNLEIDTRSISEIVDDYYSQFDDPTFCREVDYCHKIAYARYCNPNLPFDFDDFRYVVYLMMNLDEDGDDIEGNYFLNVYCYVPYFFMFVSVNYWPYHDMVSNNNRNLFANLYSSYFLSFCE